LPLGKPPCDDDAVKVGFLADWGVIALWLLAGACSGNTAGSTCGTGTGLEQGVCVPDRDASGAGGSGVGGSGVGGSGGFTGDGGSGASGGAGPDADAGRSASGGTGNGSAFDASFDSSCTPLRAPVVPRASPIDLIWAVDTSGSMLEESAAIQQTINGVVQAVVASGLDTHVVMLADYPLCVSGTSGICTPGVCVPAPLGSGMCPADSKPPNFFHHSTVVVGSYDAARLLVEKFGEYRSMLRAASQKHLFVVTDDDSTGSEAGVYADNALRFISDYTKLDPILADSPTRGRVWRMSGLYAFTACPNAARIGAVWKAIIDQTGGVHADICACPAGQQANCTQAVQGWAAGIATQIVADAQPLECEWGIPPTPPGRTIDPTRVGLELTDSATGNSTIFRQVADAAGCDAQRGGWYFDNPVNPTAILACPASCAVVKATPQRAVSILAGCRALVGW
jgi:hypothetical protein